MRPKIPFFSLGFSVGTGTGADSATTEVVDLAVRYCSGRLPLPLPFASDAAATLVAGDAGVVSQPATCVTPPPCKRQSSTGWVPETNTSGRALGQPTVASCPDVGSISTLTMPSGASQPVTF